MTREASRRKRRHGKPKSRKRVRGFLWRDDHWTVNHGELRRKQGRPRAVGSLFAALGEKLPFAALRAVSTHLKSLGVSRTGVYVAHDSMGTPRYIGRGWIFGRLQNHRRAHPHELVYFSFYVIKEKVHEREVETLLIRAAGPSLDFNDRKKRVGIRPGNVRDFEAGTLFFERRLPRGRKRRSAT